MRPSPCPQQRVAPACSPGRGRARGLVGRQRSVRQTRQERERRTIGIPPAGLAVVGGSERSRSMTLPTLGPPRRRKIR